MSKVLDEIAYQEEHEGTSESLNIVKEMYDAITRTSKSGNLFSELVTVKYVGKYPNSRPFRYPSSAALEIMKIKKDKE